jgi:bifunctional UDP-N-acetylglucosamine pyrophosphorylase/glucosamine-1-phosphate N-acetyltransferase
MSLLKGISAVVLGAGEGTRMKSSHPKVLHKVLGKTLIEYVVETLEQLGLDRIEIVVSNLDDGVRDVLGSRVGYIVQKERLGTGHALAQARAALKDYDGDLLVLYGDGPFLSVETLRALVDRHVGSGATATILTTCPADAMARGRVLRDENGTVLRVVEDRDASDQQKGLPEINVGTYCFDAKAVFEALDKVRPDNDQKEYYLTDVIGILVRDGKKVESVRTDDPDETMGINARAHLAEATRFRRDRNVARLMVEGVTIVDPTACYIGDDVRIGKDTVVYPGTWIEGKTVIGERCTIGPHTVIIDCTIGDDTRVVMSHCASALIGDETYVGPFARIRAGTRVGDRVRVGNFVELKKTELGQDTSVAHLTYLGDAVVGSGVNIGAGTITANYDGVSKNQTIIENGARIGSNTVLVAPVKVGKNAKTGAGSVVTKGKDVPTGETVVGVPAKPLRKKTRQ